MTVETIGPGAPPGTGERVTSPFRRAARAPGVERASDATGAVPRRTDRGPLPDGHRLRAMTGYEEELVERLLDQPNTADLCNRVLAACLLPPGASADATEAAHAAVRALPVAHRDTALLELRRLSLGDRIETRVDCPACGETNEVDFDLSELPLEVQEVPERMVCPLGDGSDADDAEVRTPNAGDQADLFAADLTSLAERRTWMLARTLVRLGERTGLDQEAVRALPTGVRRRLEKALDDAIPTSDLSLAVRCHACQHELDAPFDVEGFFLPRSGSAP